MTSINPRGRIYGVPEQDALQPIESVQMAPVEHSFDDFELVVDFTDFGDNRVHSESEEEHEEFDDDTDSIPSEGESSESE